MIKGETFQEIWKEIHADPSKKALISDEAAKYDVTEACSTCGCEAGGIVDIRDDKIRVSCWNCGQDCIVCSMCDDHTACDTCTW